MSSVLFVQSSPVSAAAAADFDHWYDTVHIPEVVAHVPGVVRGTRYLASPLSSDPAGTDVVRRRLTIYELDTDDVPTVLASLSEAMADGSLESSDLIDREIDPPSISAWRPA